MSATASIMTLTDPCKGRHSLESIQQAVSKVTRIGRLDIISPRRMANLVEARFLFCWFARNFTSRSYPEIGRFIDRDHSSIIWGVKSVDRDLGKLWPTVQAISKELGINLDERWAA